ncbi:MAG: ATP-binding protein [Candidatus Cloacimonas sp.]|jgi:AAA15 family ATPase/GTPase|nr:ATP-binding protein [Candidatus Cloacimonas sp.]
MLISFSISNWKCFRDEVTFSLVAGREKHFTDRLPRVSKYKLKTLPISAIYGANASGKSALVSALAFAQNFVVRGTEPDQKIPLKTFLLDKEHRNMNSSFSFTILVDELIYEYSFTLSREKVIYEKLDLILKNSVKNIFKRSDEGKKFKVQIKSVAKEYREALEFIGKNTTRNNQLFLTGTIYQNSDCFRPIYNWFKNTIVIIGPESQFIPISNLASKKNKDQYSKLLNALDTGIFDLMLQKRDVSEIEHKMLTTIFQDRIKNEEEFFMPDYGSKDRSVYRISKDLIEVYRIVSAHKDVDGKSVVFSFKDESDGTNRLLDLLPAFIELKNQTGKVYIIDELDRSLHTKLSKTLLKYYLNSCNENSRSQLIFTTHDVMLMDQNTFRRDELWVTDRSSEGVSSLYSFSDYKDIRSDKDLRKYYLQGNLKGIPRILISELCSDID